MNAADYDTMPWFTYKEQLIDDKIRRGIRVLLFWNIVFLIGYISALKAKSK